MPAAAMRAGRAEEVAAVMARGKWAAEERARDARVAAEMVGGAEEAVEVAVAAAVAPVPHTNSTPGSHTWHNACRGSTAYTSCHTM